MSRIINISEAVSIGIHSLAVIAGSGTMVNGIVVSEVTGFSRNHTSKILQILVRHKILKSVRGPKGGFLLNIPPEKVFLIDIYRLIEGEYPLTHKCIHERADCPFQVCVFGELASKLTDEFRDYLTNTTVADLLLKPK